ncbi:oxidoreductase [Streptomyces sp. NPDC048278]|uniref:oxidoreductase n=1 Tax=Streptomyces sp. NPDC048278 TaxID=3155809 RepID=UPI003417FCAF
MTTWTVRDIPDLTGTTVIVTGANAGVGRSTAQALSGAGARVVLAVRNPEKGRKAAAGMPRTTEVRELDLADLESVRAFAAGWNGPIDLLVNNAGISAPSLGRTVDGFESSFGVNHLGHFALTNLLFEHLAGRVVTVASQAERMAQLDFDDLNWQRRPFRGSRAYNDSKLANLLFTAELQRRLTAAGSSALAQAAHPGLVATDIYQRDGRRPPIPWAITLKLLAQGPAQGALPVLYAAVADIPGNSFAGPRHLAHMRGAPELIPRSATAQDLDLAARLWDVSERLTRVSCPV